MKAIIFFILITSNCLVFSQNHNENISQLLNTIPAENVYVITNSDIVLSGETLYYNLNSFSNSNYSRISKLAYVVLIGVNQNIIFKHKLKLDKGKANGDFFIPSSIKTGHYKLIAYTYASLNNKQNPFFEQDIYIINPYLNASENNLKAEFDEKDSYIELNKNINHINPATSSQSISINTSSQVYSKRSNVTIELINNSSTNDSLYHVTSVRKLDSVSIVKHNIESVSNGNSFSTGNFLPEMRGKLISGKLLNAETNLPIKNQSMSLSIVDNDYVFKSIKTNDEGKFYFNIYENYLNSETVIQVVDAPFENVKIEVDQLGFNHYKDLKFYPMKINESLKDWIVQKNIKNQIESAYYNIKKDSIIQFASTPLFYGKPHTVYNLDDFTRFNSVEEIFIEVINNASIRKQNDQYRFTVHDFEDPNRLLFSDIKPLLIYNGLHIQDESLIVQSDSKMIKSISLFKGVFIYGSNTYNGIIDIRTFDNIQLNIDPNNSQKINLLKPLPKKEYFKVDYSLKNQPRIPDYREQLLWIPDLTIDSKSKTIDFYTSDDSGLYEISIVTYDSEGNLNLSKKVIEVSSN